MCEPSEIEFVVPGSPISQPRQRHRVVTDKMGRNFSTNYTPAKDPSNVYKAAIRIAFADSTDAPPIQGPVELRLCLIFPRRKTKIWKKREMPRLRHTRKPDADNITKAVQDALTSLAWIDDSQVCELHCEKWEASGDEQPRTIIQIREIE